MYVYIYIYICVCVCMYVCIYVYIYLYSLTRNTVVIITIIINSSSFNLLRISFFKRCSKVDVDAAVFMFEFILFQIFCPRDHILFCPLIVLQRGISNAIYDLQSWTGYMGQTLVFVWISAMRLVNSLYFSAVFC